MDDIQESNAESQQGRQNGAHWTTNLKKTILVLSLYSAYEQLTADNYTYITNILNIILNAINNPRYWSVKTV